MKKYPFLVTLILLITFISPTLAQATTSNVKFHPGYYFELYPGSGCPNLACWLSLMDSFKGAKNVTGMAFTFPWSALEGATPGDYSNGFSIVDSLLAEAKKDNLQLIIGVEGKSFGTCSNDNAGDTGSLPAYFATMKDSTGVAPLYLWTTSQSDGDLCITPKLYDPVVTARRIALAQAYGARYDSNPNFEMWNDEDESVNDLYTNNNWYAEDVTQDLAWAAAARNAFPHTELRLTTNFTYPIQNFNTLFNGLIPYGVAVGGPDISTALTLPNDLSVFNGSTGGVDYRGVLPFVTEAQSVRGSQSVPIGTEYSFYMTNGSLAAGGQVRPNYWLWDLNFGLPYTQNEMVSFVAAGNPLNTTPPSSLGSVVTTGGAGGSSGGGSGSGGTSGGGGGGTSNSGGVVISGINPSSGSANMQGYVTIWGTKLESGAKVYVGGVLATSQWYGGTQYQYLAFTPPASTKSGPVNIEVVNPDGSTATLSNGFSYISASGTGGGSTSATPPVIISITPNSGSATMTALATITGSNFEPGVQVYVGAVPASHVWLSGTQSLVFAPPASSVAGAVAVKVVNPDGGTATLTNGFTYTSSTSGSSGTSSGAGTSSTGVTITPSSPVAGQTITVNANFSAGQTVPNANVVFWLFNSANHDLGSHITTATFLGSQSTNVTAYITLPSTLPSGSYYLTSGIYNQNWQQVKWLQVVKTFSIGGGSSSSGGGGSTGSASGVSISPSSPVAGDPLTLTANISAGQAVTNAHAVFWLFDSAGHDLGSVYNTMNFTGSQPAQVTITRTLPSTLPSGSYYITSGVYTQNWTLLNWLKTLITFNIGGGTTGGGNGGGGNGGGGGKGSGGGLSVDTNQSTITSSADQATFSGTCVLLSTISVTGGITTTIPCTNGAWSFTTPTYTSDGTYGFILVGHSTSGGTSLPLTLVFTRQTSSGGGGVSGIKFHPGYYIELDENNNTTQQYVQTIESLKGDPGVVGVNLIMPWSELEGAEGDYSGGFAIVDQLLAAAKEANLQLIIGVQGKQFGSYREGAGSYGMLPAYFNTLDNGSPGYLSATSNNNPGNELVTPKNYDPAVTARRIAMTQAYGARYDSDPNFEMWNDSDETANGLYNEGGPGDAGYQGDITQDIIWAAAARKAFPHTELRLSTNFFNTSQEFTTLFDGLIPYGIAVGGPDVELSMGGGIPPSYTGAFPGTDCLVFNGYFGGKNYSNILPRVAENQYGDTVQATSVNYLSTLYTYLFSGPLGGCGSTKPNYWLIDDVNSVANWSYSSVASWISSAPPLNTKVPSSI